MKKFGMTFLMVCNILTFLGCQKNTDYIVEYSTTGCFGNCPVLDIKLVNNELYYNFIKYNEKKGVFRSSISREQKEAINSLISAILTEDIKEEYLSDIMDVPATYFKLYSGEDELIKTNYDDHIALKPLDSLYSYLLSISENNLTRLEVVTINFSTREEIGIETFTPPPPPKKDNDGSDSPAVP